MGDCIRLPLPWLLHLLFCRGFAVKKGFTMKAKEFCGSARFASNRLLEELAQGGDVTAQSADDLESLVSCGGGGARGRAGRA